jgi:hypothetical protein
MGLDIDNILGIIIPIIFLLVLVGLGQLPVLYAGIIKLIKDFKEARADGDISPEEFQLLVNDLISIITVLKNGYMWIYEFMKRGK